MKNSLWLFFTLWVFILTCSSFAQDSLQIKDLLQRVKALEEKIEQSELEKIISEAEKKSTEKKEDSTTKTFKSGQRALQAINPEISLTGDAYGQYILNKEMFNQELRSGAHFRVVGLHIQSALDPFSIAKAVIEFTPDGVEFGEAYITWNNFLPGIELTAGKFRQQFGVVNRWHEHALDQFDYPLALKTILGEDGLNQMGISIDWFLTPLIADANSLTLEITNGQNEQLFSGEAFSFPAVLGHFKNYFDLTSDTYLELGLTGMIGLNNVRGYVDDNKVLQGRRFTKLAGVDLTVSWEPLNQAKYRSFLWRSELFYADKDEMSGPNTTALGGYSYIEARLDEKWLAGTRVDYTQPFLQNNSDLSIFQLAPYVTWLQSEYVMLRLQYNYIKGKNIDAGDNILRLQLGWAMGPHKHDRY
jgi:hypothetical protein